MQTNYKIEITSLSKTGQEYTNNKIHINTNILPAYLFIVYIQINIY
jgi:hypothetical protein